MRTIMVIILAVLLTASLASAASNWTRPVASGDGDWGTAANWDTEPVADTDYTYTGVAGTDANIVVTAAETYGYRVAHGYTYPASSEAPLLTIKNGGSLSQGTYSTGSHSYVGRSNIGHMVIEAGGTFSTPAKLYIGAYPGSKGTVDVYGTLDLSVGFGNLLLGENATTGQGFLNIYDGGVVKLVTFLDTYRGMQYKSFGAGSMIDIQGSGKMIAAGNSLAAAQEAITYGQISGDGVVGNVVAVYDAGLDETSIIVNPEPAAQDLSPGDGTSVPVAFPLTLSWTIPSAYDGNDVYVDVWLGTDPNALTAEPNVPADYMSPVLTSGLNATSVGVDGSVEDTYYWRVDLNVGPDVNALSTVHTFTTVTDVPPTVSIETPDTMTWSDEPVAVAATVTDDGVSTLTYGWTADPDGSGNPDLNIDFSPSAGSEDPTVTITNTTGSMVEVTLTLTATDAAGSDEASVILEVYNDACHMALVGVGEPHMPTDFNWDCVTDLLDFNEIALRWLNETTVPTGPVPVP